MKTLVVLLLVCCAASTVSSVAAQPADDPLALQRLGAERVDGFVDHFRKTGDRTTRRPDLLQAEQLLAASDRGLMARRDLAGAALILLRLGDAKRMQDQWDAAMTLYREAEKHARQADHQPYLAKALMGQKVCDARSWYGHWYGDDEGHDHAR